MKFLFISMLVFLTSCAQHSYRISLEEDFKASRRLADESALEQEKIKKSYFKGQGFKKYNDDVTKILRHPRYQEN